MRNWILDRLRPRVYHPWVARLYYIVAVKSEAVCFNCGRDFKILHEDPNDHPFWTQQGKLPCFPCCLDGVTNKTPMRNHPRFSAWVITKDRMFWL